METNYKQKAKEARIKILQMIWKAQSSHIGSNFSCVDILTVLFEKVDFKKDQIILSAGWKAAAFYYFLSQKGFITEEELMTYNQEGSRLIGLTEPGIPGVLFAGGSMQMGVSAAVGFALAKKMKGEEGTVYCLMSDGELAGGMIWESMLIADQYNLTNLKVLIDSNGLQAMGKTDEILPVLQYLNYKKIDGHNYKNIEKILLEDGWKIVSFTTIKGKGVSFMENNNDWHYKNVTDEVYQLAMTELENG